MTAADEQGFLSEFVSSLETFCETFHNLLDEWIHFAICFLQSQNTTEKKVLAWITF